MIWFITRTARLSKLQLKEQFYSPIILSKLKLVGFTFKCAFFGYCLEEATLNLVGYPASINGRSMQPTFNPVTFGDNDSDSWVSKWIMSDWVWVNCWRARQHCNISRGDIIVYVSPKTPNEYLIKRVIAVEGDIVDTNGKYPLSRVRIPDGHVWVHGDNRNISVDSNVYGPVSLGLVVGVASHIIWPLRRASRLDINADYAYLHEDTTVTKKEELQSSVYDEKSMFYGLKVLKNFIMN